MVLSPIAGAQVAVDSGPSEKAPFIGEIEPGTHTIRVEAEGYRPYERTVPIRAGDIVPMDAVLEPLPAQLRVQGDDGSNLWVDGASIGELPLSAAVPVAPGRHMLAVTKDGYRRFELEARLERGERKELTVELEPTAQRTVSLVTMSLGAASVVAGDSCAIVAADKYNTAEEILYPVARAERRASGAHALQRDSR